MVEEKVINAQKQLMSGIDPLLILKSLNKKEKRELKELTEKQINSYGFREGLYKYIEFTAKRAESGYISQVGWNDKEPKMYEIKPNIRLSKEIRNSIKSRKENYKKLNKILKLL